MFGFSLNLSHPPCAITKCPQPYSFVQFPPTYPTPCCLRDGSDHTPALLSRSWRSQDEEKTLSQRPRSSLRSSRLFQPQETKAHSYVVSASRGSGVSPFHFSGISIPCAHFLPSPPRKFQPLGERHLKCPHLGWSSRFSKGLLPFCSQSNFHICRNF